MAAQRLRAAERVEQPEVRMPRRCQPGIGVRHHSGIASMDIDRVHGALDGRQSAQGREQGKKVGDHRAWIRIWTCSMINDQSVGRKVGVMVGVMNK